MNMSHHSHGGMSGIYVPTATTPFPFPSSSGNKTTIPRNLTSLSNPSKPLPDSAPANSGPPALACPVPSCPLVFKGQMSQGYLWRHLKRPGICRRTGDEKAAWLHLHKTEYDQLIATRIKPAQRKREANRVRARKVSRATMFERRAKNLGVTEERLVAQKVAIWEGMYAAKQSGDSIGYDAWVLLDFCTAS
ncbi:hypothetical protein HOY82DRAFT_611035 [Tuber indicum]|nr:hypothetical protein HOY82DRAFT_611035 [Tuber indicum]